MDQAILDILLPLIAKYPLLASILLGMGVLRAAFKPAFSLARAIVEATPTQADNQLLDNVEKSQVVKSIAWVLDYVASIKVMGQK